MPYQTNITKATKENKFFRQVLFTGAKSQLVVMSIKKNGEIGEEVHTNVEQIFFFQKGDAKIILDGVESVATKGDILIVTPGTKHNVINTGKGALKIWTVYCPPNHIDGRIHKTKKQADKDKEDEEFGHNVQ
jgi:mannose-6-phosphate isomerase-like protein (cupin superfamily)